jgi:hypothetical protein
MRWWLGVLGVLQIAIVAAFAVAFRLAVSVAADFVDQLSDTDVELHVQFIESLLNGEG